MINNTNNIQLFKASPFAGLLLMTDSPKFTIIGITDNYLRTFEIKETAIVEKGFFETLAFTDNSAEINNISLLRALLLTAMQYGKPENLDNFCLKLKKENDIEFTGIYVDVEITPLMNKNDLPESIIVSFKNATKNTPSLVNTNTEYYNSIIDNSLIAFFLTIPDNGAILEANKAACELFGYTVEEFRQIGRMGIIDHSEAYVQEKIKERNRTGKLKAEFTGIKKNGEKFPIEVVSTIFLNVHGERRSSITINDITERKKAEQILQLSEIKYKNLFENNPMPMYIWDFETRNIIECNEEALIKYGYTKDEFLQLNIRDIRPKEDIHLINTATESETTYGKIHKKEWRHIKKNGELMLMEVTAHLINYNGRRVSLTLLNDVTERVKGVQQLKLLESVVTNTNDAILITEAEPFDEPGPKIVYVNEAFTRMTGYTADEVIGKTPRILQGPKSDKKELARLSKALRNWESCEITTVNYRKNGEEFWINFSVSPVANEKGWFTHWIAIERDITHRKNEEQQMQLLAEISQLFNQPVSLTETLNQVLKLIAIDGDYCMAELWIIDIDKESINLFSKYTVGNKTKLLYSENPIIKNIKIGKGLPGKVIETQNIQHWNDDEENDFFIRKNQAIKAGIKNIIGIPLMYNKTIIGSLLLGSNKTKKIPNEYIFKSTIFTTHFASEFKRKQLEHELNQVFDYSQDIIAIFDYNGYFKKLNPIAYQIFGYTEEELLNSSYSNFVHPDDLNITTKLLETLRKGNSTHNFENRFIGKSGKIVWLSWSSTSSKEDKLIFAVAKDITEKKNLEVILNKSNKLASIGSWEIDLINNSVYWSDITKEIREVEPDFVPDLSTGISYFKEGESQETISKRIKECKDFGTPWDEELQIITHKGNLKWIRTIGEAEMVDGKCIRIYGSFQDIDARKKAEEIILQSNERFEKVTQATNDAIWDWDIVNDNFYRGNGFNALFGYEVNKNIHAAEFWQEKFHPEDLALIKQSLQKAIDNPKLTNWQQDYRIIKNNGDIATVIDRGVIIRSHTGKAIRMVGAMTDITYRKEYEESLKQLNTTLEKNVNDLAISNQELEQFAYVASHDLQEPLRMVTSFLNQLEKKYGNVIDEKGKQYIYFAVDGAKRMRQIILDLLEYSRVGKQREKIEPVNVHVLVNEVILIYRNKIDESNATINVEELPVVKTHKTPLSQVFQNLIGNALKYQHHEKAPIITVSCEEIPGFYMFKVSDNGIGINKENFEKIFIIFQRLHNKDEYTGTGIGLSIVKKIITNLNGKIWVESEEGKGSVFYFTIPNIK